MVTLEKAWRTGGEERYSSTLSWTSAIDGVGSATRSDRFAPGKETQRPLYRRPGGPQGESKSCAKSRPQNDSILLRSEWLYRLSSEFYIWVSVHHKSVIYNKPTRCSSGSIVFINNYKYALHISDALCVHLQEHYKL